MKQQGLQAGLIRLGGKEGRGRALALASLRPELEEGEGQRKVGRWMGSWDWGVGGLLFPLDVSAGNTCASHPLLSLQFPALRTWSPRTPNKDRHPVSAGALPSYLPPHTGHTGPVS